MNRLIVQTARVLRRIVVLVLGFLNPCPPASDAFVAQRNLAFHEKLFLS